MNKDKYRKYLKEKYSFVDSSFMPMYIKIDIMSTFENLIMNNKEILKGAFNLFKNFDYSREGELTKDIDISLVNTSVEKYVNTLTYSIEKQNNDLYEYRIVKIIDLKIAVSGYAGKRIHIETTGQVKDGFHIDVAIEELNDKDGIETNDGKKFYSIERTLADKYVSMIQWGSSNTREKDYIDILGLWTHSDDNLFFIIIKELIINREIKLEEITTFKNEYHEHKYIKKYGLEKMMKKINNKI